MIDCNGTYNIYKLRLVCTESSHPPKSCFPREISQAFGIFAGSWGIFVAMLGILGNLLTLFAIPYAAKRHRFSLHLNWNMTLFILNLAVADLIYCLTSLPLYVIHYLYRGWPLGNNACYAFGALRHINCFGDWASLGMIAILRCLSLIKPKFTKKLISTRTRSFLIIFGIWIYATLLLSTTFAGYGTFGYNCGIGQCDFITTPDHVNFPQTFFVAIAYYIPFIVIVSSYFIIWIYVRHSTKYLRAAGSGANMQQLNARDLRMTWTILLVCFSYFIFVTPGILLSVLDSDGKEGAIYQHLSYCLFWCQYSVNLFIYAARSDQYRSAYKEFLKTLWRNKFSWLPCQKRRHSPRITIFYIEKLWMVQHHHCLNQGNLAELLSHCERIQNDTERQMENSMVRDKHVTFNLEDFSQGQWNSKYVGRLPSSCNEFHESLEMSIGDFCQRAPRHSGPIVILRSQSKRSETDRKDKLQKESRWRRNSANDLDNFIGLSINLSSNQVSSSLYEPSSNRRSKLFQVFELRRKKRKHQEENLEKISSPLKIQLRKRHNSVE